MKRTAKQILSIILSLAIILSSLTLVAFAEDSFCTCGSAYENGFCTNSECGAYEPAVETTGKYDIDLDLTMDVVYEISNAGQLYWLSEQVFAGNTDVNVVLTNDIVINENVLIDGVLNNELEDTFRNWFPIGYRCADNKEAQYTGAFNGQGHTISGIYCSMTQYSSYGVGFIGYATDDCEILNLGIVDSYFTNGSAENAALGSLVGIFTGAKIQNCYNESRLVGESDTGGIAGRIAEGSQVINCYNICKKINGGAFTGGIVGDSEGQVYNCYNTASIYGGEYTGGVCGSSGYHDETALVQNCYNTGRISGGSNAQVGGVVGYDGCGTVIYNYNKGDVFGGNFVGGVVGESLGYANYAYNTGNVSGKASVGGVFGTVHNDIDNCYNEGNVTATSDNVGGIASGNWQISISDCYNTGTISGGGANTGGIVGVMPGDESVGIDYIRNCYNTGDIISTSDYDSGVDVGGIVGEIHTVDIENCYNTGNINAVGDEVGGIAGYSDEVCFTDCYNLGDISGGARVGGISGSIYGSIISGSEGTKYYHAYITHCYNEGTITGTDYRVGGIVGISGEPLTKIEDCYNVGNVFGASRVGGIVGYNIGEIYNCHSVAETISASNYCGAGGIAGCVADITNLSIYGNCYYLAGSAICHQNSTNKVIPQNGVGSDNSTIYPDINDIVEGKTADQFASGEICYLLNGENAGTEIAIWKQIIGTDQYPKFEGKTVYYNEEDSSFYNGVISLDFWKEQIRFDKDENGDYAGTFDYRVLATMTSDELFNVYETQEDARKGIQEIGFIMAKGEDVSNFDYETAKSVALGAENDTYTKVSLYYITTALDTDKSTSGKGDFVVSCMVEDIPDADKGVYLATIAYMCYKDDNGNLVWEFSPSVYVNNFVELNDKYYSQAFPS